MADRSATDWPDRRPGFHKRAGGSGWLFRRGPFTFESIGRPKAERNDPWTRQWRAHAQLQPLGRIKELEFYLHLGRWQRRWVFRWWGKGRNHG